MSLPENFTNADKLAELTVQLNEAQGKLGLVTKDWEHLAEQIDNLESE